MSALPLNEVLGDFEDAILHIQDPSAKKEINLVADSIRLGGAILKFYPEMLAAQLNGRLLPERQNSPNIRRLLEQCDEVARYLCTGWGSHFLPYVTLNLLNLY